MTTATDTETGLLRAILDLPECDNARLAYADALEESGDAERAEFIRVQCELETTADHVRYGDGEDDVFDNPRFFDLQRRLWELWEKNYERWFRTEATGIVLPTFSGTNLIFNAGSRPGDMPNLDRECLAKVRRGFIDEVRSSLAVLVGGECENCGGTGLVDGDRWEQSEPCPDCGGEYGPADEDNPRGVHPGTGTRRGIAAELIRTQPVQVWMASDVAPHVGKSGGIQFAEWFRLNDRPQSFSRYHLPNRVFDSLKGYSRKTFTSLTTDGQDYGQCCIYDSEAEAIAALSDTVATIAKQQGVK